MSTLLTRLRRLEERLTPLLTNCECKDRRHCWLRSANEFGELAPDTTPEPSPILCAVHGEVRAFQIILTPLVAPAQTARALTTLRDVAPFHDDDIDLGAPQDE